MEQECEENETGHCRYEDWWPAHQTICGCSLCHRQSLNEPPVKNLKKPEAATIAFIIIITPHVSMKWRGNTCLTRYSIDHSVNAISATARLEIEGMLPPGELAGQQGPIIRVTVIL